jgi:hypothetical protein
MQGLTRIAVRKNRLDGHPSDRNRITYARSNPANRESASGACIHPQKNLPEEFLATRKARRRSGPAEVLRSASARSRLAEPEGFEPIGRGFAAAVLTRGDAQSAPPRSKNRGFEWIRLIDWRSRRDSNPRYAFGAYNGLANRRLQPLGHSSGNGKAYRI